jgi:hypothetical protein
MHACSTSQPVRAAKRNSHNNATLAGTAQQCCKAFERGTAHGRGIMFKTTCSTSRCLEQNRSEKKTGQIR